MAGGPAGGRRRGLLLVPALSLLAACLLTAAVSSGGDAGPAVAAWIDHGGCLVSRDGKRLVAINPDTPFVPASILKIATAAEALAVLGADFRFRTDFLYRPHDATLFIRGHGDPFLISEEVQTVAARLLDNGLGHVSRVVIDNSFYAVNGPPPGAGTSRNPYDAILTATAVNFNTIAVRIGRDGMVRSAEPQTPTLPLMSPLAKGLPPGTHRLAINRDTGESAAYAAQLVCALLNREARRRGMAPTASPPPTVESAPVPAGLAPLYIHVSATPLPELIRAMLRYSNNGIANALFLACGVTAGGPPADWRKAVTAMNNFLVHEVGLTPDSFTIRDGAGLSRANRISPSAMVKILDRFKPHMALLPTRHGIALKSGTLTGVYSYAGYLPSAVPFAIILNQTANNRDAVLRAIAKRHGAARPPADKMP